MTPQRTLLALAAGCTLVVGCVDDPTQVPVDAVRIGALLPFSGDLAASGINLERALLTAAENVNARGGIGGREVAIIAVDSNQYFEDTAAVHLHRETLKAFLTGDASHPFIRGDERIIPGAGIDALIGPLIPTLGIQLAPEARDNNVVHMAAAVSPEGSLPGRCSFSLFPSFRALGRALGNRLLADGVQTAAVIYLADDYNIRFLSQISAAFESDGGTIVATSPTESGRESYVADVENALSQDPDALILLSPPRLGSRIVQAFGATGFRNRVGPGASNPLKWYFGPLLRVDDFPRNVNPRTLIQGGVGVAPGVEGARSTAFVERFRSRWDAEPTLDAQYLFDSVNVLLLALESTARSNPGDNLTLNNPYAATCQSVESVTKTGTLVSWQDVDAGIAFDWVSQDLDYDGLTGPVELDDLGNANDGLIEFWQVDESSSDSLIRTLSVESVRAILAP